MTGPQPGHSLAAAALAVGGGVAVAANGNDGAAASTTAAQPPAGQSGQAAQGAPGQLGAPGAMAGRVQTGEVTAVSASSITVKSEDGFTATYAIDSSTTVAGGSQLSAIQPSGSPSGASTQSSTGATT